MDYLMPSEIARLVLGYLKSTGCHSTWESFLRESPDLKEYAEYVRRGREYPTTIGGKNLMQLLDAGFQITQTHGTTSSSELMPSLQNLSSLLRDVLAHMQSGPVESNRRNSDGRPSLPLQTTTTSASRNDVHSGTSSLPQQPYHTDEQSSEPLRLTTSGGFPPAHHASSPQQQSRHPHPNGDTLNYHVHTHLPPLPLLPPSIASVLKQKKQLPEGLARFEPPEKDLGVSTLSCHPDCIKMSALGCCYTHPRRDHLATPHLGAYEEGLLAYMNSFPRPLYPPRNPYISDEEPVRDSGIDLRKRPETGKDSHSLSARQDSPASSEAPDMAEKEVSDWRSKPGSDLSHRPENEEGLHREGQGCSSAADISLVTAEPESEGFEVSEAAVETRTEVSEEIDVDGSSRGPSPLSEPGMAGAGSACATSAVCTATASLARAVPPAASSAAAVSASPMLETLLQQTPDLPVSKSPTMFETPENVGAPPLPARFPDPDSPRAILAQERSLQPSLSTPVKEVRFDPDRFYSPRRKSLIPRRRLLSGISPSCKQTADSGSGTSSSEESREVSALLDELVHNFPFVEKLVENINQAVVGPDGTCSEGAISRPEALPEVTAIDAREMLTSQDSTMPDSLIKEILNKTENDPVFEEALAQICERLDTTNEVHGILVTPSKSSLKSRLQRGISSPRTPCQSRRPASQPTTPQLMNLFASPRQSHPTTPPRRSPRLSMQAKQAQRTPPPPPAPPPPPLLPPPPPSSSPPPPAATGPLASSENTPCLAPVSTRAKQKALPQTAKVAPVNQTNKRTYEERSMNGTPCKHTSPAKQSTNQSSSKLPLPPRPVHKSPLKVNPGGTFRMPVSVPLKSLVREPAVVLQRLVLSPVKTAVQVVSKATENGETVTCISIPDPPQLSGSPRPKQCTTLADVIDSVLSPDRRRALCQTESIAVPLPSPSGAGEAQSPVVIMPECGQVMLCTNNGVTTGLRALTQSPLLSSTTTPTVSSIIYPNVVFSTMPPGSPFNFVMSGAVSTTSSGQLLVPSSGVTKISSQSGSQPIAKKRLPLLQPREPLPTQPSPPAAFKRLEGAKYNRIMATRVKNAKHVQEITKHNQAGPSVSAQVVGSESSSVVLQPSTSLAISSNLCNDHHRASSSEPRTPPSTLPCSGSSASASNEKSPRLKSLVSVASKHATSSGHVRALDFNSYDSNPGQGSVDSHCDGDPNKNLAKTIESIRTSLTGAMNRVLRSNTECSSGLDSGTKKRRAERHNTETAKKARNEDYLKSMDVNKFLDKIHHD